MRLGPLLEGYADRLQVVITPFALYRFYLPTSHNVLFRVPQVLISQHHHA